MKNEPFMLKDIIEDFVEDIKEYDSIHLEEIPEYRLFISQIEEFFDTKLGKSQTNEDRKTISKTMIQNYVKDGLIMSPDRKSYNRNHVILLSMIYDLKSILAIKDIKNLLTPILEILEDESESIKLEDIYDVYFDLKTLYLNDFAKLLEYDMNLIKERIEPKKLGEELNRTPQILLGLILIAQANIRKMLVEKIIEENFKSEDED